jgi:tRNA dimethylallyltransferase
MERKPIIVLLAGPTASGKSKIAIKLSKVLDGEIVNADSMQVYKELKILTSRPSSSDLRKIKHHLYGFVSVKKNFSTGSWLNIVTKKIESILKKKKVPILVGGTGLYFKALVDGLTKIPDIPISLREKIRKYHKKIGQEKFYNELLKLDPKVKNFILKNDSQRSIRAYEVKKFTKKSLYNWTENTKPIFDPNLFQKFFIHPPRDLLLQQINLRINRMFRQRIKQEVKEFTKLRIHPDLSANKVIGLQEIKNYLAKKLTLAEVKNLIQIRTRQYAKRQFTWARGKMSSWKIINPKNCKDILSHLPINCS